MTVEEIEKLAMNGKSMPQFSTLPETCLFQCLSALYARYRAKQIDREQAHTEKLKILKNYEDYNTAYQLYFKVMKDRNTILTGCCKEKGCVNNEFHNS